MHKAGSRRVLSHEARRSEAILTERGAPGAAMPGNKKGRAMPGLCSK
jgi:hypothetical protein